MRWIKNTLEMAFIEGFVEKLPSHDRDTLVILKYDGYCHGESEITKPEKIPLHLTNRGLFEKINQYFNLGDHVNVRYLVKPVKTKKKPIANALQGDTRTILQRKSIHALDQQEAVILNLIAIDKNIQSDDRLTRAANQSDEINRINMREEHDHL